MGTRGLTIVRHGGEYKVAQYGQWDHYPGGQGTTVLAFCREHLSTAEGRQSFGYKLGRCRYVLAPEVRALCASVGVNSERIDLKQSKTLLEKFPTLHRDTGAKILGIIQAADSDVLLQDEIAFAGDSLFCEWAYVVDLDAATLEVYKGFRKSPLPPGERFSHLPNAHESEVSGETYYPVALERKWLLDDLPSEEEFLRAFERDDEEG